MHEFTLASDFRSWQGFRYSPNGRLYVGKIGL